MTDAISKQRDNTHVASWIPQTGKQMCKYLSDFGCTCTYFWRQNQKIKWLYRKISSLNISDSLLFFPLDWNVVFSLVKTWHVIALYICIFLCPSNENSYLASIAVAWFHSVYRSSPFVYDQQNMVLEEMKHLILGLLWFFYEICWVEICHRWRGGAMNIFL